ncbi:MAG: hypothetical protein QMD92_07295 [bacterium]|nr:hypothetical protein [bacterium]
MVGTKVSMPIRVDYMNKDYDKAFDLLMENKINIIYKTVASVEPYHATIHLSPEDSEKAKKILNDAGIKWSEPVPFY